MASAAAAAAVVPVPEDMVHVRPMRGRRNPDDPAFQVYPEAIVNVCSTGHVSFSTTLSPFNLGPATLPFSFILNDAIHREQAKNMENAWQYSKVYKKHTDPVTGEPTAAWYAWARAGYNNASAVRFPMGRGAKPEYSFGGFNADNTVIRLGYVEARFRIYAPLYADLVDANPTGYNLLMLRKEVYGTITLLDFDGWNNQQRGLTLRQVMYNPGHKCGHGFVLAMMLTDQRVWLEPYGGQNAIDDAVRAETTPSHRKRPLSSVDGATASASTTEGEQSGAAGPPPAKMHRGQQPPPVRAGVAVPPLFQEWARAHGFGTAAILSEDRAAFGEEKYGQPLMTEDGRVSAEDAKDEVGDFFHYTFKAKLNGENVAELGPLLRAAMCLYRDAFAAEGTKGGPTAFEALAAENASDISALNKEVRFLEDYVATLRMQATRLCERDGYSVAPPGGVALSQYTCYKCGQAASSLDIIDAPSCIGRGKKLMRPRCSTCPTTTTG